MEDEDEEMLMYEQAGGQGAEEEEIEIDEEEEPKQVSMSEQKILEERTNMMVAHFLFSMIWSVGAVLDGQSRLKFDEFFKSLCEMEGTKAKYPRYYLCYNIMTCKHEHFEHIPVNRICQLVVGVLSCIDVLL